MASESSPIGPGTMLHRRHQAGPWPFDPAEISWPVRVIHGEREDLSPIAHSRHTAEHILGAEFKTVEGHGHASVLGELPRLTPDFMQTVT